MKHRIANKRLFKWIGFAAVVGASLALIGDIILSTRHACASGGRTAIIQTLNSSAEIARVFGSLTSSRCVFGTLFEKPDYGIGTIWLSIVGTQDRGMIHARVMKNPHGFWLTSAQLDLDDSGSYFIDGRRPSEAGTALRIDKMEPDDKPLMANRAAADEWTAVTWPEQRMRFEVPVGWKQARARDEIILSSMRTPGVYAIVRVTPAKGGDTMRRLMRMMQRKELRWFRKGYARPSDFSPVGGMSGYIRWPHLGTKSITWNGIRDHPDLGAANVSFIFGAATAAEFENNRPIFGAILESTTPLD